MLVGKKIFDAAFYMLPAWSDLRHEEKNEAAGKFGKWVVSIVVFERGAQANERGKRIVFSENRGIFSC